MLWPNLKDDLVKRIFVSLILYSIVVCFQNIKKCQSQLGCYNRITNKKIRVNLTNLNQITKMICHLICLVVKKKRNCAISTIYIYLSCSQKYQSPNYSIDERNWRSIWQLLHTGGGGWQGLGSSVSPCLAALETA